MVAMMAVLAGLIPARFGSPFPAEQLAGVRDAPGCVTADDPTTLIRLNLLNRNLDRGCPLVADLGGYTYDLLVNGHQRPRLSNPRRSSTWTIRLRFRGSTEPLHPQGLPQLHQEEPRHNPRLAGPDHRSSVGGPDATRR